MIDAVGLAQQIAEPKWLPWHLDHLQHRPTRLRERIEAALTAPSRSAAADLDRLLGEVLDIVDAHVEQADTATARFALDLPRRQR